MREEVESEEGMGRNLEVVVRVSKRWARGRGGK